MWRGVLTASDGRPQVGWAQSTSSGGITYNGYFHSALKQNRQMFVSEGPADELCCLDSGKQSAEILKMFPHSADASTAHTGHQPPRTASEVWRERCSLMLMLLPAQRGGRPSGHLGNHLQQKRVTLKSAPGRARGSSWALLVISSATSISQGRLDAAHPWPLVRQDRGPEVCFHLCCRSACARAPGRRARSQLELSLCGEPSPTQSPGFKKLIILYLRC